MPAAAKKGASLTALRRLFPVMTACLLLSVMLPVPGQAAPATQLDCKAVLDLTLTPGLSLLPNEGSYTTGGERGTWDCTGIIRGRKVTGPGTIGIEGQYGESSPFGDSCLLVIGPGNYSFTLPTDGGPVKEQGTYHERMFNRRGQVQASSADRQTSWRGDFEFIPTEGNCVTGRITAARVEMVIRGRSAS